jgi:hypothetical protein
MVVPAPKVQVIQGHARIGNPAAVPAKTPQVEAIRDGNTIVAIDVICSCGERTRIVCDYDAA